ncbi:MULTISPECIES: hypothetical protein [Paenibacillus]|uniref:Uncharacterized protein n=1 Tax=Paenibacillus odorifer TaxID=189426 RepID=A0A1R0XVR4_9BACL|nr:MULTISPECIES: hypothetical protein [Paenibacillus]AIQ34409.1 hypothetical protein R50345_07130 [Paenibacillus sp. FSL R5-0345]OMD39234.1 hypothetical protein BSK52_16555 [Paenibacillus odorifer]
MAFLVVICFLAFITLGIIGIVSAIRKKPAKIKFLLSLLSFILMIVFTVVGGNSDSDKTLQTADTSRKTSTNSNDNSTTVSAEVQNDAEQVKADAEAKAAAEAEAKKKADADAKADAEKKEKEAAAIKAKQDAALAQMVKTVDEVEGITWYQDKEAPKYINENGIYAYFGIKDGQITSGLRLKIQYTGDSWIFIKNYIFNIDGQKFEINPGFMGAERDMSTDINSPGVWEYHDETLNKSQIKMLTQLIESEKTIMRLEGDQRKEDRTISASQKAALKRVLDAYIAAGGEV